MTVPYMCLLKPSGGLVIVLLSVKTMYMTRQITISYNDHHYMYDVGIERNGDSTVYHVEPNSDTKIAFPKGFDITKPDNSDQPQYNTQELNDESKQVVHAIWEQISRFPPQFKGKNDVGITNDE